MIFVLTIVAQQRNAFRAIVSVARFPCIQKAIVIPRAVVVFKVLMGLISWKNAL